MNITKIFSFPWSRRRIWSCLVLVIFLFLWWGVPTYKKWRADKLVDELCAKDGGIKVYETIKLPANMFNEYGQPIIRFTGQIASDSKTLDSGLHFSIESWDIIGNQNVSDISKLVVWKSRISLLRNKDGKLIGETSCYSRPLASIIIWLS